MSYFEELIKFKFLVGMQQIENGTFDEEKFNSEVAELYKKYCGENVTPLVKLRR